MTQSCPHIPGVSGGPAGTQRAPSERGGPPARPEVQSFYRLHEPLRAGTCCHGTACFVARHLDPARAARAAEQEQRVYCLGQCFAAPAIAGSPAWPRIEARARQTVVLDRLVQGCSRSLDSYRLHGGYRAWPKALGTNPEDILNVIATSELRGRGGAGFPVGRKWRAARLQPAAEKVVIANADEGDAGAYIDRFLLEDDPHVILEAMLIAAHAIGASRGWIYLRSEYPAAKLILENALAEARAAGLLGSNALGAGRSFDIAIHMGAGSYVCGEETALIRSLEGKRPEVMARPPYATEHGFLGHPTVVNNVETLANIPWILEHGADSYRQLGFSNSRGTKVVSLNSLFQRPGLYEVEFGVSVRHIVEELGGGLRDGSTLKGVLIGGPLAGILPPERLDTPFGFEELKAEGASVGHGGVVAFDQHTRIIELLHHVCAFAADESCGKCTPCRLGSRRLEQFTAGLLANGAADYQDVQDAEAFFSALKCASLCGLGVGLGEFAASVWRHYRKELETCWR